jgi:hypothetical protein
VPEIPVPAWAINHLRENLPPDFVLLNAAVHRRGVVVANSRLGAVVVTKSWFGEPHHSFLLNPRERVRFACDVCRDELEFHRLELPALVHCGICGSRYAIGTDGLWEMKERRPWPTPAFVADGPEAGVPNLVADERVRRPAAAKGLL